MMQQASIQACHHLHSLVLWPDCCGLGRRLVAETLQQHARLKPDLSLSGCLAVSH